MQNYKIKALSLFSNVGIAECYLSDIGIDVKVANELKKDRAKFYNHIYPEVDMVIGDITETAIFSEIVTLSKKHSINLVIATPPCQGMSTAGKKDKNDERNSLITYVVKIIKELCPDYVFLENVTEQLTTHINYEGNDILIPDYLKYTLGKEYNFNTNNIVNMAYYGIPQSRERAIILLTKKNIPYIWEVPDKLNKIITLQEAIGHLPTLDPYVYDIEYDEMLKLFPNFEKNKAKGMAISKWHYPPSHIYRQVLAMQHTPTGKSAFENIDNFKPRKNNGEIVKGYKNTYKRQNWDMPAYTVTMYNRTISSQNNVHPGKYLGKDKDGYNIYSDPRVLTIYELMIIMSIPKNWDIPEWASENFIRSVIGEGIPPLFVKNIMERLFDET